MKSRVQTKNKIADLSPKISKIIINVNDLSAPIKRKGLAKKILKIWPTYFCLLEDYLNVIYTVWK